MSDSASDTGSDMDDTAVRPAVRDRHPDGDERPTLAQRIMAEEPARSSREQERPSEARPARPADAPQHRGPSRPQPDQDRRGAPAMSRSADPRPQSPARPAGSGQAAPGSGRANGASAGHPSGSPAPAPTGATAVAPPPAGTAGHATPSRRHAGPSKGAVRRTRKARLRLSRIDPWSVMKTAFMFSIAAGIVLLVAVYAVWGVIEASGLFQAVDSAIQDAVGTQGDTTPFRLETYINTPRVMGAAALIAVVDVVLITALTTLASFLYNLAATVLGGLEITLAED